MSKFFLLIALFSSAVFATPVNVNNADAKTISAALIGINLKEAEALVVYRETHGAFNQLNDLKQVIGIGEKTIAVNKTDILFTDKKIAAPNPVIVQKTPPLPEPSVSGFPWLITTTLILIVILLAIVIDKYHWRKKRISL